jgi:glucose/arabinose dehydrogenase
MLRNCVKQFSIISSLVLLSLVATLSCAAVKAGEPPLLVPGWNWRVFQSGLRLVDNIVVADNDTLYVTLERKPGDGQLAKVTNGKVEVLLDQLDRPDGLAKVGHTLYLTEEILTGRILSYHLETKTLRERARLRNPEGIAVLANGNLVLTEDIVDGRLLQLDRNGGISVMASALERPEGLRVSKDGTIYIAETRTGRILSFHNGEIAVLLDGLNKPDQLAIGSDGSLWIAEDENPGRVLRYKNGSLDVIASNLASPQGLAFDDKGRLYVAEQHRHRILLLFPSP